MIQTESKKSTSITTEHNMTQPISATHTPSSQPFFSQSFFSQTIAANPSPALPNLNTPNPPAVTGQPLSLNQLQQLSTIARTSLPAPTPVNIPPSVKDVINNLIQVNISNRTALNEANYALIQTSRIISDLYTEAETRNNDLKQITEKLAIADKTVLNLLREKNLKLRTTATRLQQKINSDGWKQYRIPLLLKNPTPDALRSQNIDLEDLIQKLHHTDVRRTQKANKPIK